MDNNAIGSKPIETLLPNVTEEIEWELPLSAELMLNENIDMAAVYNTSLKIMDRMIEYKELMMTYNCAMKEIRTKFEVLNAEFNVRYQRNPINFINTRLKRVSSILEKMENNDIPFTIPNIENYINDVAGIRVICSYVDDIYMISDALTQQDDVTVIQMKDYIANPKPNGYRSLHLIVSIPVFFASHKKYVKVEVQIRTIAMDFWATLEHQLKYKQRLLEEQEIADELKRCADSIADTDSKMLAIRQKIEANAGEPTEDDLLLERIKKIDFVME